MAWIKLDDRFWSNRKVRKAGPSIGVYVLALTWSADELTDGRIPCEELDFICTGIDDPKHHAERLIEVGLFDLDGDVYVIPDYLEFNESAETIRARREKDRERKSRGGRAASNRTPPPIPTESEPTPDGIQPESSRNPAGVHADSGSPDPTRPDPTKGGGAASGSRTPSTTRGTRITPDWRPPDDVADQMTTEYPSIDHELELAKFIDYWLAKSGKDATKRDWPATWRNWIRRAGQDQPASRASPKGDIGLAPVVPPVFEGHDVPDHADVVDLDNIRSQLPEHLRNRVTRNGRKTEEPA